MRRSTNNPWTPPGGINSGYFTQIGGEDTSPGAGARFPGQIGSIGYYDTASALKSSFKNPNGITLTLFQGAYQLVKFANTLTSTGGLIQRGEIVFWDTNANNGVPNFVVTNTPTATTSFRAGVVVNIDTLVGNAQGKFGFIQVAGLASMRYGTVTSAVIGNVVVQPLASNEVDALADGGAATTTTLKTLVGLAYELPVTDSVLKVLMNQMGFYPNVGRG